MTWKSAVPRQPAAAVVIVAAHRVGSHMTRNCRSLGSHDSVVHRVVRTGKAAVGVDVGLAPPDEDINQEVFDQGVPGPEAVEIVEGAVEEALDRKNATLVAAGSKIAGVAAVPEPVWTLEPPLSGGFRFGSVG